MSKVQDKLLRKAARKAGETDNGPEESSESAEAIEGAESTSAAAEVATEQPAPASETLPGDEPVVEQPSAPA